MLSKGGIDMRRILTLILTVAVGFAAGVGVQGLNAQPAEIKRTVLLKTDLPGVEGKEAVVFIAEIPAGVATGKHRHPGNELIYVLEGSYILEVDGTGPVPLKAGEVRHAPPGEVHEAKTFGSPGPSKVLVFLLAEKGQPLAIPVH
jgi:quercetin dioxygenase-like cupin family protein